MWIHRRTGYVVATALVVAAAADLPGARGGADPPTPTEAIARLKSGNARFVANPESALPITVERRSALATGQTPFAAVLSKYAAYSRASPSCAFSPRPLFSAADGHASRSPSRQWSPVGTNRKG